MTNTEDEFGPVEAEPEVTAEGLARIQPLVQRRYDIEARIGRIEDKLAELKADVARIDEVDIPAVLDDLNVDDVTVTISIMDEDGNVTTGKRRISVIDDIHAKLPVSDEAKLRRGIAWLKANDHGSIVRRGFVAEFGASKKESAAADAFAAYLKAYPEKVVVKDKDSVNHQRLTALFKELYAKALRDGEPVDQLKDILGAYVRRKAKIE
jgi:hypothetical protein